MAEYIEREALLEKLHEIGGCGAAPDTWADGYDKAIDVAYGLVQRIPAADVAEVRRGHWIDCEGEYSSYVRCSVCGDEYTNWEADCAHTDFCPGCGADMRGRRC